MPCRWTHRSHTTNGPRARAATAVARQPPRPGKRRTPYRRRKLRPARWNRTRRKARHCRCRRPSILSIPDSKSHSTIRDAELVLYERAGPGGRRGFPRRQGDRVFPVECPGGLPSRNPRRSSTRPSASPTSSECCGDIAHKIAIFASHAALAPERSRQGCADCHQRAR
jgi:hypothetical protein